MDLFQKDSRILGSTRISELLYFPRGSQFHHKYRKFLITCLVSLFTDSIEINFVFNFVYLNFHKGYFYKFLFHTRLDTMRVDQKRE